MTIIRAEGLSKSYILGQAQRRHATFREAIAGAVSGLGSRMKGDREPRPPRSEFWALQDVAFSVEKGDVLGIIGRNGAGKSTLLKILSRITEPTRGRISIRGRIASLLEVGTGFHPELTGRENVFLNGAVLGMGKAEIRAKFDEIVAFAEVEQFLETPVKRYSSGMYVRLAFAVAAHLEPEILVVDEVLAVGDAQFQKKCLGKMSEVATKDGRTVLFVSHNMGAVQTLCSRGILLHHGRIVCDDSAARAIAKYSALGQEDAGSEFRCERDPGKPAQVLAAWFERDGEKISEIELGTRACLVVDYIVDRDLRDTVLALLLSKDGVPIMYSYDSDVDQDLRALRRAGSYRTRLELPTAILKEGTYTFALLIGHGQDNITDPRASITLTISNSTRDLTHRSYKAERPGFLIQELRWHIESLNGESLASRA